MVVVPGVLDDAPAPEQLEELLERRLDGAAWVTENSCWTCQPSRHPGLRTHRDREAPFAVDEADDPLLDAWPFLLIVRTGRIFTAHVTSYRGV